MKYISKYIISSLFLLWAVTFQAQDSIINDSLPKKIIYGFRVGIDISRPIIQTIQKEPLGIEMTADYRITKNWYTAIELGFESEPGKEDFIEFHTKGNYAKIGVNYNAYENWESMSNEVFFGLRYGFSTFEQQLLSYTAIDTENYFGNYTQSSNTKFDNLSAHWGELQLGIKVEVLKNTYLSASVHYKKLIKDTEIKGFSNLYIPGFTEVYLNNNAVSFNYTISYLIPFKKTRDE